MTVELEERVVALERELGEVRERLARIEPAARVVRRPVGQFRVEADARSQEKVSSQRLDVPAEWAPEPAAPNLGSGTAQRLTPGVSAPARAIPWWKPAFNAEELLGGRLLALAGGIAVLVGAIFFVGLAIDRGWMGETARVALALTASSLLLGVGAWLYERKGRTQAALCAVGAAIASLYLSLAAGSALYDLLPSPVALCAALAVGALATALAVRWNARTIAALGILGCLLSPLFAGGLDGPGALFLLIAYGAAVVVCTWRRWEWLAASAFAAAAGQIAVWSLDTPPTAQHLAVLAVLGGLTVAGTIGYQLRVAGAKLHPSSAFLVGTSALLVGALGLDALPHADGELAGGLWVGGVAALHAALGAVALAWRRADRAVGYALLGVALVAADVAVGLLAGGVALSLGWALSAFAIAWAIHRIGGDRDLLRIGLGGQLSLAIVHTLLFDAPPGAVTQAGVAPGGAIAAVAAVTVTAFGCARLACTDWRALRIGLDALALVALAYVSALTLDGVALALAWAAVAVALGHLASGADALVARIGALSFLGLAAGHALSLDAPPDGLVDGVDDLGATLAALGAVGLSAWRIARSVALPQSVRLGLHAFAIASAAYGAALALDGPLLVVAWAGMGIALSRLRWRDETGVARRGAVALLGLAAVHTLALEAPPDTLLYGSVDLGAAVAALAAVALGAVAVARDALTLERSSLLAAAGTAALALASVAIVSVLTPTEVGVAQDAQVALSALWGASGLALLWVGLRRRRRPLRLAGLGLLVVALGKVFAFDLQALDSIWRVLSCVGLGLLLLLAALAYQRMRPPDREAPAA
jgi:uncharacterized membrane protein